MRPMESSSDLAAAAGVRYLEAGTVSFSVTEGWMLTVRIGEEEYPVVYLHGSFPHTDSRSFISVRTADGKEIGIIRSLDDYPAETVRLLESQLQIRYFTPEITKVTRIREEFGYSYWETETTAGTCRFTVRGSGGNVKWVTDRKLLVLDVDGNRFVIPDVHSLSPKEYSMVEMFV